MSKYRYINNKINNALSYDVARSRDRISRCNEIQKIISDLEAILIISDNFEQLQNELSSVIENFKKECFNG